MRIFCLIGLFLYVFITHAQVNSADNCKDKFQAVEKAISALKANSVRNSSFYFEAASAAQSILKSCKQDDVSKRKIFNQASILEFYANYLLDYDEYKFLRTPVAKKKFFESKIDTLNMIDDPTLLPIVKYLKGLYYSGIALDYSLAISDFKSALDLQKDWTIVMNELAWSYMFTKKFDSASIYVNECVRTNPRYAPGYITLGYVYGYAKNIDEAFNCFRTAMAINSQLRTPYFALGWWYENLSLRDSSIYYYRKAIQVDSNYVTAYSLLGGALKSIQETDSAEWCYKKCLEINPYLPDVYIKMGDLLDRYDNNKTDFYQQAVKLDSFYLYTMGMLEHNRANYEEAIQIYKRSLAYNNDKWTNRNLGVCYYYMKKYAESEFYLKKSIDLDSTWADPYEWIAAIYLNNFLQTEKQNQKVIEHLQKAFTLFPDAYNASRYYSFLALDALQKKDSTAAFNYYLEGGKNGCDSCLVNADAMMYEHGYNDTEKDYEKAERLYSKALWTTNSNFAWDQLLNLYESGKVNADIDNWKKANSGITEKITLPCINDKGLIEQDTVLLLEYYPEEMHPLLWEGLRIKKERHATFLPEVRKKILDYYTGALNYSVSFPYYAFYRLQYESEDQHKQDFNVLSAQIIKEPSFSTKITLLDSMVNATSQALNKNSQSVVYKGLLAKTYLLYGQVLTNEGRKKDAAEKLNKAIELSPADTAIVNAVGRIKISNFNSSLAELIENTTQEEQIAFVWLFLEKGDKENSDKILRQIISNDGSAELKYNIYKSCFENGHDLFSDLLLSDPDPAKLKIYREKLSFSAADKYSYFDKIDEYQKVIKLDEVLLKIYPAKSSAIDFAADYNNLGWFCLLSMDFNCAKMAINRGLELDKNNFYLKGNLAHILLFSGNEEKARAEYLKLKDQPFGDPDITGFKNFKETFLADFRDFQNANFSTNEMEKVEVIKKILNSK